MPAARTSLVLLLAIAALHAGRAAAGPTVKLVLIGTSDLHGHIEATPETLALDGGGSSTTRRGGLALLGGYVGNARLAHPGGVVLVDSGDMLQGTLVSNLSEGAATVKAMNQLGYAAAAIGNHEFDFGPLGPRSIPVAPGDDPRGALKARAAEANFPWLTCNVRDRTSRLPVAAPRVKEFTIVQAGGIKVGIVGGTSEDTPRTTAKQNLVGLVVEPLAPSVIRAAAEARRAGATVVVLAVHAGGECKEWSRPDDLSSCVASSEVFDLARALPPGTVDAIFAGHTHQGVSAIVHGIPIAQAFADGKSFARIDLTVDAATGKAIPGGAKVFPPTDLCAEVTDGVRACDPKRARGRRLVVATYEGAPVASDPRVDAAFATDLATALARRSQPLGVRALGRFHHEYKRESALGNLVADLLRAAAPEADVGLTNGGGVRADLPKGDLTYGQLFEVLPFDNRLAIVRVRGVALRRLITRNLAGGNGILSLSGLRAEGVCRGDQLEIALTLEDGRPLLDAATYTVVTSDFLALGGDDFGVLAPDHPEIQIDPNAPLLRERVIALLRTRPGALRPDDPALFDEAHPRIRLPGPRPVHCPAGDAR